MYWRIVRINGDGTIRMIYDGTTKHANGESSKDRQIEHWKRRESRNRPVYMINRFSSKMQKTVTQKKYNFYNSGAGIIGYCMQKNLTLQSISHTTY